MQGSFGKLEGGHPKVQTVPIWAPHGLLSQEGAWVSLNSQWGFVRREESLLAIKVRLRACLLPCNLLKRPCLGQPLSQGFCAFPTPGHSPPQARVLANREVSRKACGPHAS